MRPVHIRSSETAYGLRAMVGGGRNQLHCHDAGLTMSGGSIVFLSPIARSM